jgi:hypothetical protein
MLPGWRARLPAPPPAGAPTGRALAPTAPRWAAPPPSSAHRRGGRPTGGPPLQAGARQAQGRQPGRCCSEVRQAQTGGSTTCPVGGGWQPLHRGTSPRACPPPTHATHPPVTCMPPAVRARSPRSRIFCCPPAPPSATSGSTSRTNLHTAGQQGSSSSSSSWKAVGEEEGGEPCMSAAEAAVDWPASATAATCTSHLPQQAAATGRHGSTHLSA